MHVTSLGMMTRRSVIRLATAGLTLTTVPLLGETAYAQAASYRLRLPAPTGPYPIGTTELHLIDHRRPDPWDISPVRELMVSLWYPAVPNGARARYAPPRAGVALADEVATALGLPPGSIDYPGTRTHARTDAPAVGRHPVILYSPGLGTSRILGTHHVEDLASRGYVVVTIDHTGEAPVEFPDGRVTPVRFPTDDPRTVIDVRVADTRFVLDRLADLTRGRNPESRPRPLPPGLHRALELRRTGMLGYSAGGFTAAETMLVDRRIDAGVNLDGTLQYGFPDGVLGEAARRGLDRPFLLFGADGHSHLPQPGTELNDPSWTSFWNHQRGWKLDLGIPDGTHGAFADYQWSVPAVAAAFDLPPGPVTEQLGTVDPAGSVRAQRAYIGAFFEQFLRGRHQPLLRKPSPRYPEVIFVC